MASELAFGFSPQQADPASQPEPVTLPGTPPTLLRGQIDLVEERTTGERRITDLKGGRQRVEPGDRIQGGMSLQRPLYALAYAQLHGDTARPALARLSYLWGQAADVEVEVDADLLKHTQRALEHVHKAFARACFPAVPAPDLQDWRDHRSRLPSDDAPPSCPSFCAYLPVCGRGAARRAGRKQYDPERMRTVRSIRRQP